MEFEAPDDPSAGFIKMDKNGGFKPQVRNSFYRPDDESEARLVHQAKPATTSLSSNHYETIESEVHRSHIAQRYFQDRGQFWTSHRSSDAMKWVLLWLIGACTGLVGLFITFFTKTLTAAKFSAVFGVLEQERNGDAFPGAALLTLIVIQVSFVFVAAMAVYVEPLSAGSGIPEIKCFLNGINLPRVCDFKTLVCKAFGVLFSVAGGLPAGKEGPMIHSGAVVAALISQARFGGRSWSYVQDFRNDREKRDFVACGAAAGVCAAFGAPIGGVLFALEEGATYWSTELTWRGFFCGMMGLLTLYWVNSGLELWGRNSSTEMFSFGQFQSIEDGKMNFSVWELFLFIILGSMGGLIGATFNGANKRITKWRMRNYGTRKELKAVEALGVALLMSCVTFMMPIMWTKCTPLPRDDDLDSQQERDLLQSLVPMYCDPETEYNEVATLWLSGGEAAIRQLFHSPDRGINGASTFSSGALFLFFLPYTIMACINYGVAVPSGLFVPSLLSGAAFGRLFGHLLHKLDGESGTFADSGTFALIGAASVLGGMARMTISLTVILLEATGDMQYLLPLMLSLLSARWMGNIFNHGLYDIHIHLKNMPMLEPELEAELAPYHLTVEKIMSKDVECLRPFEKVRILMELLRDCDFECFPVVDPSGLLCGTMLRKHLTTLLHQRAYVPGPTPKIDSESFIKRDDESSGPPISPPIITYEILESVYPNYPSIHDINISGEELDYWLDLRPYLNSTPYNIQSRASVHRAYVMFRTMGLRHLPVVDNKMCVVGVLTRKNLLRQNLEYHTLQEEEADLDDDERDSV